MRRPKAARPLSHYIRCEAHGETGDGKTRFAASFPGPKLWLDPTHGCDHFVKLHLPACPRSVDDSKDCLGPDECGGDFVDNTLNPDDFYSVLEWGCEAARQGKIRTIVLDDVSVMQDRFVLSVVADPDEKTPIDDWGKIKRPLNRILNKIAGSPVHLCVTSRASMVAVEAGDSGKINDVRKAARYKCWDDFVYPCDFVFFLYSVGTEKAADKLKYFAMIQKSRVQDLSSLKQGAKPENPSFDKLFKDLLEREKDLPLPEYDDPDRITKNGATVAALGNEQKYLASLAALKAATDMAQLGAAWTPVATDIAAAVYSDPQQAALVNQKNATKALIAGVKPA